MTKRKWAVIALTVIAAAGGYWMWSGQGASGSAVAPATAEVKRATVRQTVLATGQVEAKRLTSVGGRVSGQIDTLNVAIGDRVGEGDLIVQIDSRDQQNDVRQARANLANIVAQTDATKASLRKAELELDRQKKLARSDYSSQQTLETAAADVEVYKANIAGLEAQQENAEVNVETAQIALDRTRIIAPFSGTVVAVNVQQGQTVNATQSAPTMVKLADLDTVIIKAEISEADVVNVAPGQIASFTILGDSRRAVDAAVNAIEPAPSEIKDSDTISTDSAVYYNGVLEVPNPDHRLRIGMTTQVTIILAEAKDVLTVPAAAIRRDRDGSYVEVQGAMGTTRTPVEVGITDRITAEIRSGLSEGQRVVTGRQVAASADSNSQQRRMGPPMGF